jgi:extracellular elastinolytic metalloproteinase
MSRRKLVVNSLALAAVLALVAGVAAQGGQSEGTRAIRIEGRAPQPVIPGGRLTGPNQGNPLDIALQFIDRQKPQLGLSASDLQDMIVSSQHTSEHNGVTHVYFAQRYRAIEVYGAQINVNIGRDGSVLSVGNSFVSRLVAAVNRERPSQGAVDALERAAMHLGRQVTRPASVAEDRGGPASELVLEQDEVSSSPITAKLVYQPVAVDQLRLAWLLDIDERDSADWWLMTVDAETGEVLGRDNLTTSEDWGPVPMMATDEPGTTPVPLSGAIAGSGASSAFASSATTTVADPSSFSGVADGSMYNVFPLPYESPSHGPRTQVTNPAHPVASPFGWHDTNGVIGPEFTRTRGNNVHAYTDIDANNVADPGSDPDGGAGLQFDFPLDLGQQPTTYRPAAVANLFYWNNIIHDVFYGYGFTEAAGNFQVSNYGRGGTGNDDVRAEAQDGSGTNNANFSTPADGLRPRMQMFVWTPPMPNVVAVNPPSAIAANYSATGAAFGPTLNATGPLTGDLVLALDAANPDGPSPTDACSPLTNAAQIAGNIALLDRGACAFVIKVKNAQDAGAIAVIVANNAAGAPITMGGADASIFIPAVMVSQPHGDLFKAHLPFGVTLSGGGVNRDSDMDNGVIAHEYAHGISNRLTGGRTNVSCLGNQEQMGEGWSDWLALALTGRVGDTATTRRGVGSYLLYQGTDGNGIRPTPYTTDMAVNPSTYDTIKTAAVPHGVGYVWATMLWDVYWNLVQKHGYNEDVYGDWTSGGNNLAIQLVMDGMKLQPCSPGFVTGRNAILQADQALTGGANQCPIWEGFARRGLGVSAAQGSSNNRSDGTEAFDLPASCVPAVTLTTPTPSQYSDPIALSATVSPPVFLGQVVTGSVEFFISGTSVGSSAIDSSGVASRSVANVRAAGNYTVTATFTPAGPAGTPASSASPVTAVVTKENAATVYAGDAFATTAAANIGSAQVLLAADVTEEADGASGDLSLARVAFELFKSGNLSSTPDQIVGNVPVAASGHALALVTLAADVWTVKVRIEPANGYWTSDAIGMGIITVAVGSTDARVTGGGWAPDGASSNGKGNFGFTVSPQKNGNLRGNLVFVFRGHDGFDYVVKSTSWQGGSLTFLGDPVTHARFNGRATVQKIDPATGAIVDAFGNYGFIVDVADGDLGPQGPDLFGITVLDTGGQVWHQVGAINNPIQIGGGNISIKSR